MEQAHKVNYGKWRAFTLASVYLLMGIHIAHWKIAGRTLAPLEFNEVLYTIHLGIITAGFLFMAVTIVATLIFGRFFCSWMCHIVALQDASAWILQKLKIKPKHFRSRILIWIPFMALIYLFVLPQIERIYLGQPHLQFRILNEGDGWASFMTNDFWRNLPAVGVTILTFFVVGFVFVYFLGTRSFCQYACPYGALFSLTDRVAPGKIILSGDCNQCGKCTVACNSHILVHKEVDVFGKVVDPNCLKDLDCIEACPKDALKFGFTKPSFLKSINSTLTKKKAYDFTVKEDILLFAVFLVSVFIFRGLYDLIPFLVAFTISILVGYFIIVFLRMMRLEFVRTGSVVLKHSNKITKGGKIYLAGFAVLIVFTVHSAWIHYHQYQGTSMYNQVAWNNNGKQPTTDQSELIGKARQELELVDAFGLFHPATLSRQLAAIYLLSKETDKAKIQLEHLLSHLPKDTEARLRYAKILFNAGNEAETMENLKQISEAEAITEHERKIKSDALVMLGHIEEKNGFASVALGRYQESLKTFDGNQEAVLALGVLYNKTNQLNEAENYLSKASAFYKNSSLIENNLAVVYMRMHRYAEAELHLSNLLTIEPNNVQAQYNLAMMKFAQNKFDESRNILQGILQENPSFEKARTGLEMISQKEKTAGRPISR